MRWLRRIYRGWRLGRDEICGESRSGDQTTYMRRWYFWCPWFGARLHHILRSDADRDPHDHPWNFVSFLLTGGYTDVVPRAVVVGAPDAYVVLTRQVYRPRWSVVRHAASDLHRLVLDRPVWTLVLTGPKVREWGFMTARGMIHHRDYAAYLEARKWEGELRETAARLERARAEPN